MKIFYYFICTLLLLAATERSHAQCSPDTDPPVPYCINGLTVHLDNNGEVVVWATDFDAGSYDDCSAVTLYLEEGLPPSPTAPSTQSLTFDTTDIGIQDIVLWVVDQSGNQDYCIVSLEIITCTPTTNLVCNDQVTVYLSSNGTAQITPETLLEGGPYCAPLELQVEFAPGSGNPPGTTYIDVDTNDIGTQVVSVWGLINGTSISQCWGNVTITSGLSGDCTNDQLSPICISPANTTISRVAYNALNIDPFNEQQLSTYFGSPSGEDNCGVQEILKGIEVVNGGNCGIQNITRNFMVIDSSGNTSTCQQEINIVAEWTVHLPADHYPGDPTLDSLEILDDGGSLLGVAWDDQLFDFDCDGTTDKIVRTWNLVDWCSFTNIPIFLELPRQDLDGDGQEGDSYDILAATDSVFQLENSLPAGSLGKNTGSIRYSQVITYNYQDTVEYIVNGTVFHDSDGNCAEDSGENGMSGWPVTFTGSVSGQPQTVWTDSLGHFTFVNLCASDTLGTLTIPIAYNYGQNCPSSHTVAFTPGISQTLTKDFPVALNAECPLLWTDLSAPFLRRCFENYYTVSYCNYYNEPIADVYVEVQLDTLMSYTTGTLPETALGGNLYRFDIGTLEAGECGDFRVNFNLDCNAVLGATHCTEAHIYPDTLCPAAANWSGANLEANGYCQNDSIFLQLTNTGTEAMSAPLDYIVVEDVIMYMQSPFDLEAGEVLTLDPIPANGATWRLEAPQEPGHPYGGIVATAIEGCGGIQLFGLVNQFPLENANPFIAIDCQQNIGSFDPNDKRAYPAGYGGAHFIYPDTDLEYKIRFQNTGTDTAFRVVIEDLLDPSLDPVSVRPGASSHPYVFEKDGSTLRFVFDQIMLPDSNINEPASHGFVQFRVAQQPGLSDGTRIENEAAIYFDFNDPIITNTVFHTIGRHFIEVVSDVTEGTDGLAPLQVYPNPSYGVVHFEFPGNEGLESLFTLTDATGKRLRHEPVNDHPFVFRANDLPAGLYFYSISRNGERLYSGKIILR